MKIRFKSVSIIALLTIGCTLVLAETEPGGLAAGLKRHYKFSTSTLGPNGYPRVIPGTVLTVRKDGIVGFGEDDASYVELCSSEFEAGEMRAPKGGMCTQLAPPGKRVLKVSETVCVTALKVDEGADTVSMFLATCGRGKSGVYHALVRFHFPRGSLKSTAAAKVVDTINLALSEGEPPQPPAQPTVKETAGVAKPGEDAGKDDKTPGAMPDIPPPPPPVDQAGQGKADQPASGAGQDSGSGQGTDSGSGDKGNATKSGVSKGQSTDQVVAILGPPKSIADLGPKLIYYYPKWKVIFMNGKVSEIQSI